MYIEFVDKKNCTFSFFHIFKIDGASTNTASYQLWPDQPVLTKSHFRYIAFSSTKDVRKTK